ncbi:MULTISPECIES: hypothetical protein [unclassified Oceanobacter]|uniref:hypothetical protein n=2 Tax=Gammaproteobacteria TaxID=1236 RepID=UPI002732EB39|nr:MULTISPECIES: hypothetical protein [unclassified Oceanobacter]MDP2610019.1 hypothetical protein [Oceanobacter sp. 1_MG-2023]MDP2613345.1 hypothetical protein [Oceanobacter sp. 2_MG-2023]
MAITDADLKLMRAERNTDNADGGGMMTGTPLSDGDINNLWDDIDSTELARGGVSIRRFFPKVETANTDKLLGSRVAIIEDAAADNVSTLLYKTGDHYAERAQIQAEIERYVVIGIQSPLRPVGTQREGQNALVLYADRADQAPEVGAVIVLEDIDTEDQQFVKITDVDAASTVYTYVSDGEFNDYSAWQFVVSISQPLERDFEGLDPSPTASHPTRILTTQASGAAKYYGITQLAEDATTGDTAVVVDTIQAPLVPVVSSEVALIDQVPGVATQIVQAVGSQQAFNHGNLSGSVVRTLMTGWKPGSLTLTIGGSTYHDVGTDLQLISGTERLSSASVLPATGQITLSLNTTSSVSGTYTPAVAVDLTPYTAAVDISVANRQLTYTDQLSPIPARGSLRIDYLYLGGWYQLSDDGSGAISGDAGETGTINYDTGSVAFVLSGEPDDGSAIIFTWGSVADLTLITGTPTTKLKVDLPGQREVGSTAISWDRSGSSYSLTELSNGTWTGAGSAEITSTELTFSPSSLPDGPVTVAYTQVAGDETASNQVLPEQTGGSLSLMAEPGVLPQTVHFQAVFTIPRLYNYEGADQELRSVVTLTFNGRADGYVYTTAEGETRQVGSINTSTGVITIDISGLTRMGTYDVRINSWNWTSTPQLYSYRCESQTSVLYYRMTDTTPGPVSVVYALNQITVDVNLGLAPLLIGAQVFTVDGVQVVDRGDGYLYRNWSATTAAGLQCGQINHADGSIELDYSQLQPSISTLATTLQSGASGRSSGLVSELVFRTPASPLRASGVQILARRASDTALMRADSDGQGDIAGSFDASDQLTELTSELTGAVEGVLPITTDPGTATGTVELSSGIIRLSFTQPVLLSTLTYNAVAYTTIPVDPDLLGLDPVKLPTSGKVPIFQAGYLALVHNTQTIEINTPTAAQTIDCGRTDLALVRILDAAGTALATDQYSVNNETGIVTLADPFSAEDADSNSLTLPLTVSHRVQDLCAVGVARVDGQLQFLTQLTHDYAAGSQVSAVVELGDLQARVEGLFCQKIDVSGVFDDDLAGDTSVAQYDDLNYPLQVDNTSAVQERWKILWRSASTFDVIGEQRGIVLSGVAKDLDCAPINPFTNTPYFTLLADGHGTGWVTGNTIRFNTVAAAEPVEAIRTTLPSHQRLTNQSVYIEFMGDAD